MNAIKLARTKLKLTQKQNQIMREALENVVEIDIETHKRHPEYEGTWSEYADVVRVALAAVDEVKGE